MREPREFEICRIPGSTLIPLGELPKRLAEMPQGAGAPDIVVHCKMGGRSAKAVALLREHGITRQEPDGRHPRVDRQGGSVAGEILTDLLWFRGSGVPGFRGFSSGFFGSGP